MPRPTKLTPQIQESIVEALKAGNVRTTAALSSGVSYDSFARWIKRTPAFLEAVEQAEAEAEAGHVATIHKAAEGNWCAAAWWLERRRSADWARKDKLTLGGDPDAPLFKVLGGVDPDEV